MEPTVINASELRIHTREIMERVKYKGERFLIQTFGQPTAVIMSVDEYRKIIASLPSTISSNAVERIEANEKSEFHQYHET